MFNVLSRHDIFVNGPGQVLLEKRYKFTLRYMNFCAYWNQF